MQFAFLGFFVLMCSRFWFLFFVYFFVFFVVVGGGDFFGEGVYLFVFVFVYHFLRNKSDVDLRFTVITHIILKISSAENRVNI
jgi:hypothetical protein